MIQITGREMFKSAAARLRKERMAVRRHEAGKYDVTNKAKGRRYLVSFTRIGGRVFGSCTCEAGHPTKGNRVPVQCKHILAAVITHNAINAVRRAAKVETAPIPAFVDAAAADATEANY